MRRHLALLTMALVGATLAFVPAAGATGERATGRFVDGAGNAIGAARLEQVDARTVRIVITLRDATVVKPGQHGIHFHAVGACVGPDFATAGPHFNPTARLHGTKNPQGPHAGDLPNLANHPPQRTGRPHDHADHHGDHPHRRADERLRRRRHRAGHPREPGR